MVNAMNNQNQIIFSLFSFYTESDKALLFEWIEVLPSVERYRYENDQLSIILKQQITDEDLLDLIAICVRYKLNTKELSHYMHENNEYWWTGPKFQVIYPHSNKDKKELLDKNKNFLRLDCTAVDLYTQLDKTNMFKWMERISCVKEIIGLGPVIYLYVNAKEINHENVLELEGLFSRYNFDIDQLVGLLPEN